MSDIKRLSSPFGLLPEISRATHTTLPRSMCNCDDDDDFGMARECAFVCNAFTSYSLSPNKNKSKKRGIKHAKTRTKRANIDVNKFNKTDVS